MKVTSNHPPSKKRTNQIVDFAVPADHRVKLKETEKRVKNLDLARELKQLWNMKVTVIPVVIGALRTVTKGMLQGLEDLEENKWRPLKTTALLTLEETWYHSNSTGKISANAGVKTL